MDLRNYVKFYDQSNARVTIQCHKAKCLINQRFLKHVDQCMCHTAKTKTPISRANQDDYEKKTWWQKKVEVFSG